MRRIVVWFKNDLRLSDNPALHQACMDADEIIPFYCFDEAFQDQFPWGFPKIGDLRKRFIWESVADLQSALEAKSAPLQIHYGPTLKALQKLQADFPFEAIYCAQEYSSEEIEAQAALESFGFRLMRFEQYSLYKSEDLPFEIEALPKVFTEFRKKIEKYATEISILPAPAQILCPPDLKPCSLIPLDEFLSTVLKPDPRAVLQFKGGSKAAWQRLHTYFWEGNHLQSYKETRNGLLGPNYSSKFSPWLATGSISPREIYGEIKRYEKERVQNQSTYWLYFELLWRDFFRFTAAKEGDRFFKIKRNPLIENNALFESWRLGQCGQDFVDANMRELLNTGFMSNRGRQNVASYLVHDLKLPWYLGASWFESQLIDYDVCSNYGNWTYVAGIGNDPRQDRYFNLASQAKRYDPEALYRQHWLKE
ncbi:DASH family cryptochrome [Croceimicrobium sp.]|uniref:DASH family cryptochrome n=1 Tax=Croceimicrobium sp. TaxID=2828340 RepID=UPI003BA9ED35